MYKVLLTGYISILTGVTIGDVGETFETGTYVWYFPVLMFVVTTLPALLGYLAGRDDA